MKKELNEDLEKLNIAGQQMFESFSFEEITKKMLDTYIKKNHDYGNAFSEMCMTSLVSTTATERYERK